MPVNQTSEIQSGQSRERNSPAIALNPTTINGGHCQNISRPKALKPRAKSAGE